MTTTADTRADTVWTCLGCGDVLPPHRGGYCDGCVEWEPDGPNSPYPPQGDDDNPDPDPAPGRMPQVGDRVVLHPSIADGDAYHQFGIVIGTPGFTESASPDPVPYYSVNFDTADGTVENLWLEADQIQLAPGCDPDDDPTPPSWDRPDAGRTIARQWTCDTRRFATILRGLDPSVWYLLAAPCAQYRGMTTPEVLDRWERLARGVELPKDAREAA